MISKARIPTDDDAAPTDKQGKVHARRGKRPLASNQRKQSQPARCITGLIITLHRVTLFTRTPCVSTRRFKPPSNCRRTLFIPKNGYRQWHLRPFALFSDNDRGQHTRPRRHSLYFPPVFRKRESKSSDKCDQECMHLDDAIGWLTSFCFHFA